MWCIVSCDNQLCEHEFGKILYPHCMLDGRYIQNTRALFEILHYLLDVINRIFKSQFRIITMKQYE